MSMIFCRGCGKEIHESAPTCPHCGAPQNIATGAKSKYKSQTVAALLSAFLGGFGAQRFYLGPIWLAVIYLLLCWTGIPGLIAIVETFIIVFSSQATWARKYNNGVITPPAHLAVKILVLVFPVVAMIGILAAIAIPQYATYTARAKLMSVQASLAATRPQLIDHMMNLGSSPLSEGELASINEALKQNNAITATDAFSYGNYADVGAQMRDGNQQRTFYMVTRDRGQTWQCLTTDTEARNLPKDCQTVGALPRPEIPKPAQKIGLWTEATYQDALKSCIQRATEHGNPNAQESCSCFLGKVSMVIPESVIQQSDMPHDAKELIQLMANECAG